MQRLRSHPVRSLEGSLRLVVLPFRPILQHGRSYVYVADFAENQFNLNPQPPYVIPQLFCVPEGQQNRRREPKQMHDNRHSDRKI